MTYDTYYTCPLLAKLGLISYVEDFIGGWGGCSWISCLKIFLYFIFQFLDMSSLQAALPNAQLPSTYHGGVSQPWFPQNPMTPYIPAAGQGTFYLTL